MLPTQPTIKDVGRAADVSQATASYVLNNSKAAQRISKQTQTRVRAAAQRLGYKFDPTGRALQRGYNNQVALLIVTWNLATSHAATAMAISQAAARYDLALTMHVAEDDLSAEAFIRRSVLHNLCGLLALWDSPAFEVSSLRHLTARGVPIIDLLPGNIAGISVVTADREDAGFRATRHLLELGHRAIGFIGDADARPQTTLRKLAGYRRALEAGGVPYEAALVENVTEFGFEGGQHGLPQLLERRPDITALFCINDAIALGAIDAASALGRRCPRDLSVIGFGDSPEGRHWRPKLTTFARSSGRVAEEAIRLISGQRRARQTTSKTVLIPEELLLRESTSRAGPPTQDNLRLPVKRKEPTGARPCRSDHS
jgi:LacI family repressor for deo operon, udp, cdd, tsx, nupC, and nupG